MISWYVFSETIRRRGIRSASGEDLGLEETEEEKQEFEKKADESKDMLSKMTEMLGGRVKEVRLSQTEVQSGLPGGRRRCIHRNGKSAQFHADKG